MNETQIGQLVIDLKIKLEGLEKGIETAQKKLKKIEESNEKVKKGNQGLETSYIALAAVAVASLAKIKSAVDDGVQKYNSYINSMNALQKTAKATNTSMKDISKTMSDVNEFKFIDDSDLSKSMQNLLLYGFSAKQAGEMLKVMQDAAVGNREPQYELSEAIKVTTDGIRMENSVLSNAVGVEKNIAKMHEDYAKKIGKTADTLTQAEKVQAVYNGFMDEASKFTGSAREMSESYQGQQAQLNATNIELSRTLGETMMPTLTKVSSVQLSIVKGLTEFISNNKVATSGIVTFTTALLATVVAITAVRKAWVTYKAAAVAADMSTKAFTASLLANPITLIAVGCAAAIAGISMYNTKVQESIDKMEAATEKSKTLVEALKNFNENGMSFTDTEKSTVEQARDEAQEIVRIYEEKANRIKELNEKINAIESKDDWNTSFAEYEDLKKFKQELKTLNNEMKTFEKENFMAGQTIDTFKNKVEVLNKTLEISDDKQKYLTLTNQKAHRETLINIAQTKADIEGKKQLLEILKKGKDNTEEYADAKNQLVKAYPELAKVNENTITSTEEAIKAEEMAADKEWVNAQVAIQASILQVQAMASNSDQIIKIAAATQQSVEEVTASLQNQIMILGNLAKLTPDDFKGSVKSTYKPKKSKSSSSYSNKRLDNYKKEIEYKKSLDQLSLQQEIAMYQTALKKYAKTTDEKRELEVKIYELQKELQQQDLDNYISSIEHKKSLDKISIQEEIKLYEHAYNELAKTTEQKEELEVTLYELRKELAQKERNLLNEQTKDYENFIKDQQNLRGAEYDVKERKADLDKLIKTHQEYLNQILKDERYSLDERKQIYREELQTIRDYEQQKRDLRVGAIDDTVNQLTNAIKKQNQEMQKADKEAINKNLELVKKWKEARIEAINEEYDARIKAIQDELDALDKAEQQKSRDEEDSEYERKRNRLQDLIDYEHDAVTKANYQKELDKLVSEYQKTLDKRALEDRKEALNAQKDLLKEEQSNKVQSIEDEAEKQTEIYNKQLEDLDEYYNKQIDMAQETAEKMLLNVQQNQDKIIDLLNKYGDKYEITGQSLGEKLAQGINDGLANKIENIIQTIQDRIDGAIENQISKWASASYKYEAGMNKPQTSSIVINQTNNIEQNPEMPSETYRKLRNIDEELAASLAGM